MAAPGASHLAGGGAGEDEQGHVGAGDEKHEANGTPSPAASRMRATAHEDAGRLRRQRGAPSQMRAALENTSNLPFPAHAVNLGIGLRYIRPP